MVFARLEGGLSCTRARSPRFERDRSVARRLTPRRAAQSLFFSIPKTPRMTSFCIALPWRRVEEVADAVGARPAARPVLRGVLGRRRSAVLLAASSAVRLLRSRLADASIRAASISRALSRLDPRAVLARTAARPSRRRRRRSAGPMLRGAARAAACARPASARPSRRAPSPPPRRCPSRSAAPRRRRSPTSGRSRRPRAAPSRRRA